MFTTQEAFRVLYDSIAIERLAGCLLHFIWQGTVIGLLAAIALRHLSTSNARARYTTCVISMLLMATCLPLTYVATARYPRINASTMPSAVMPTPISGFPLMTRKTETREAQSVAAADQSNTLSGHTVPTMISERSNENPTRTDQQMWLDKVADSYSPLIVNLWIAGACLMLARLALGVASTYYLRLTSDHISDPAINAIIRQQALTIGVKPPRAAFSCRIAVPVVLGIISPLILLPPSMVTGLSPAQFQAVIAHEIAHIRRYDPVCQLVQRFIEAMLFFHPAVWYVSRRMTDEREHCCDDIVVSSGTHAVSYADALVRAAELFVRSKQSAISPALLGSKRSSIQMRIRRLLLPAEIATSGGWLLMFAAFGFAVVSFHLATLATADESDSRVTYTSLGNFANDLVATFGEDRARVTGLPVQLEVSADRERIWLTESIGYVAAYDTDSLYRVQRFRAHDKRCLSVTIVDNTSLVVTTSIDGTARLWDTAGKPRLVDEFRLIDENARTTWLNSSHSEDGRVMAIRSDHGVVLIDVADDGLRKRADLPKFTTSPPHQFALTPDGTYLVTCEYLPASTLTGEEADNLGFVASYPDTALCVWDISGSIPRLESTTNNKPVFKLTIVRDADRSMVVCASEHSSGNESQDHRWRLQGGQLVDYVTVPGHKFGFASIALSPNGRFCAVPDANSLRIDERLEDGTWRVHSQLATGQLYSVDFIDNRSLVAATNSVLQRWDYTDGRFNQRPAPHGHLTRMNSLVFQPETNTVVAASEEAIKEWSLATVAAATPAADTDWLRTAPSEIQEFRRWSDDNLFFVERLIDTHKLLTGVRREPSGTFTIRFSIDAGSLDQDNIWSWELHPVADVLATGHWDGTVRLWDISAHENGQIEPRQLISVAADSGHVTDIKFTADGRQLVTSGFRGTVRAWDVQLHLDNPTEQAKLTPLVSLATHLDAARCVAFSPDGQWLASSGDDGQILVWNLDGPLAGTQPPPKSLLSAGQPPMANSLEGISVGTLDFLPDGRLLSGDGLGRVKVWDLPTGQAIKDWQFPSWVWRVAASPDGKLIAVGTGDGIVNLLRAPK
ncbi:MAG: M48 family metalloprotease [Planctomycetales bacterium]|nr:M48 family metalloprotease [Planctomycetales bacterium]